MLLRNKILGSTNRGLRIAQPNANTGSTFVKAASGGGGGGGSGGSGTLYQTQWGTEFDYFMSGLLPNALPQITDYKTLTYFYRDMYLYDPVAGACVDIQSTFPFSDFELRGLKESELDVYLRNVERLSIRRMLPEISVSHLVDGMFCGMMVFDTKDKEFMDTLVFDPVMCEVKPNSFFNADPEIRVNLPAQVSQMMNSSSQYTQRYVSTLPSYMKDLMSQGSFYLDPLATLYIPRKTLADRANVSYLHRILPMYLVEKAMFRGTLTEAHRRQRAMGLVTLGTDEWEPEDAEIEQAIERFMAAENDPLGGWIGARQGTNYQDIRPGGDFWKWTDMVDTMVQYKLRALGISEAFLTSESSFASADSAYSTFLESQNAYRESLTYRTFYQKIFPPIAVINGFYKDKADVDRAKSAGSILYNASVRQNLRMPEIIWHKHLGAEDEEGLAEMLEMLDEKGIPIPLKMWLAAAKITPESLFQELKEDTELRRTLEELTGKDSTHESLEENEEFEDDVGPIGATKLYLASKGKRKMPLLAREFGYEVEDRTVTGKRKYVPERVQAERRRKSTDQVLKTHRKFRDPEYAANMKAKNKQFRYPYTWQR